MKASVREYQAPVSGSRLWNRCFCLIIIMSCCANFTNFFMGSALSLWIVDMGGSNAAYGTLHSLYSVVMLIMRPITGWIIDHGNRKTAFFTAAFVIASSMILMLVFPIFGVIAAMRLLQGVGTGLATTITNTSSYDYMPPDKMDRGIGYITLSASLISALTATVGVGTYNSYGYVPIILWSLAAVVVAVVCASLLVFRRNQVEPRKFQLKEVFDLNALFEKRSLKAAILVALSVNMAFGMRSYIILMGRSLGVPNPGWFTTIGAIGLLVVRFVLDALPRGPKTSQRRVFFAYGVFLVYLVVLSNCANAWMFFGAALLWPIIYGILTPTLQSFAIGAAPPERRGAAGSTYYVAADVGIILGSYFGGVIADAVSYRAMFGFALIPVALCILFFAVFRKAIVPAR